MEHSYISNAPVNRIEQGDVTRIVDTSGNNVVYYVYDTWGKVLSVSGSLASTVGVKNPIRYRGYYYDTETELYYLSSRYYDPEVGRFISPDDVNVAVGTGHLNLYAYCDNDPINRIDPNGYAWWHWAIGGAVVALLVVGTIVTAGGLAAGMAAFGAAASGVASASLATTVFAFAAVGAGTVLAASAVVASIDAAVTWGTTGSFDQGWNTAMDYGEAAMWGTITGGATGAFGGYMSYKEQYPKINHSWSTERSRYWKSQGYADGRAPKGRDGYSMVLHHAYGRSGAGFYKYYPMTRTDHIAFHNQYGYTGFHSGYPHTNFWEIIRYVFGG